MENRIILSGMGGQGVISLGNLMGIGSMLENRHVSVVPSYGAEMRGGISNCFVTISDKMIGSPVFYRANIGIFMYQPAMDKFIQNIMDRGLVIYNKNMVSKIPDRKSIRFIGIPANFQADKMGDSRIANIILAGVWCRIKMVIKYDTVIKAIKEMFKNKSKILIDLNIEAFKFGYQFVRKTGLCTAT